jgi:hypothetical protein
MLKRNHLFLIPFFIFLLTACQNEVEPSAGNGIVQITEIELVGSTSGISARKTANNEWHHSYQKPLLIIFKSDQTGKSYSLELNPNDLSKNNSLELPIGLYTATSTINNQTNALELPLDINQKLSVSLSKQDLTLKATSHYGLFTITDRNLSSAPRIVAPFSYILTKRNDFYFGYFDQNQKLTIEIPTQVNQSFKQAWNSESFIHRHFSLDNLEIEGDIETFSNTDFLIEETIIPLNKDGIPNALMSSQVAELASSIAETSGLAVVKGRLFSHNDGGNTNEIFELNPNSGEVIRSIKVSNASNVDWEDLTVSSNEMFIGDFGNNSGNRKNLAVYKVKLDELLNNDQVTAEKISFSLSDQFDFQSLANATNYDCEAFIFWESKLYLFTKNWKDAQTNVYSLSPETGNQIAESIGSFNTKGLVTGAAINEKGDLVLLGYENKGLSSRSFVWLYNKFGGDNFFSGKSHQIYLGSPAINSQAEGVDFFIDSSILISGEAIVSGGISIPARLSELDLTGFF